jgi:type IV secretory pathway TraG/TraD family ATPase VirD4
MAVTDADRISAASDAADYLVRKNSPDCPFWNHAAKSLTAGLLMALTLTKPPAPSLLFTFRRVLTLPGGDFERFAALLTNELGAEHPAVANRLERFARYDPDDRETATIRYSAAAMTDWLDAFLSANAPPGEPHLAEIEAGLVRAAAQLEAAK